VRRNEKNSRFGCIAFLLWFGLFILPSLGLTFVVLGLVGALMVLTLVVVANQLGVVTGNKAVDTFIECAIRYLPRAFRRADFHVVADQAMRRAGYRPQDTGLRLDDIGLLVYHGEHSTPKIYRTADVPTDASHIRPFAVLNYHGRVKTFRNTSEVQFLLVDEHNKTQYVSAASSWLNRGQNLVTPPTWFRLREQQTSGQWAVGVNVAETLLGIHEFRWLEVGGEARTHFTGDGEIADAIVMPQTDQGVEEPVSVDELLEEHGEEVSATQTES
jgi:hypothetical protein